MTNFHLSDVSFHRRSSQQRPLRGHFGRFISNPTFIRRQPIVPGPAYILYTALRYFCLPFEAPSAAPLRKAPSLSLVLPLLPPERWNLGVSEPRWALKNAGLTFSPTHRATTASALATCNWLLWSVKCSVRTALIIDSRAIEGPWTTFEAGAPRLNASFPQPPPGQTLRQLPELGDCPNLESGWGNHRGCRPSFPQESA